MEDSLLKWREEFPILAKKTYLINNSLGAMPRAARAGLNHFADMWENDGVVAWHYPDGSGWLDDCEKTADLIGSVIISVKVEGGDFTNTEGSNAASNLEAISQFGIVQEQDWPYQGTKKCAGS